MLCLDPYCLSYILTIIGASFSHLRLINSSPLFRHSLPSLLPLLCDPFSFSYFSQLPRHHAVHPYDRGGEASGTRICTLAGVKAYIGVKVRIASQSLQDRKGIPSRVSKHADLAQVLAPLGSRDLTPLGS